VREYPIILPEIFITPMLKGEPIQIVKLIRSQHRFFYDGQPGYVIPPEYLKKYRILCPYGKPGDRLWVEAKKGTPRSESQLLLGITSIIARRLLPEAGPYVWEIGYKVIQKTEH
jgi:hypothetical protein